jgi:hypothetical protein
MNTHRFYIVATRPAMVGRVTYANGDCLKTVMGTVRSWANEDWAYSYLHSYIQGPGEEAGWRVTPAPEAYR